MKNCPQNGEIAGVNTPTVICQELWSENDVRLYFATITLSKKACFMVFLQELWFRFEVW